MGIRAGLLTENILIERITYIKNIFGANEKKWIPHTNTRSIVKFNSGNQKIENNEIINSYSITFTTRNYHDIDEKMRIVWNGKKYRILSIFPDKHKQSIDIIGELINE